MRSRELRHSVRSSRHSMAEAASPVKEISDDRTFRVISLVVGSTSFLAGLLFYFGWQRTNALYRQFGIEASVLRLSPPDYILRSLEGTFIPLGACVIVATVVLLAHQYVKTNLARAPTTSRLRLMPEVLATTGAAAFTIGIVGAIAPSALEILGGAFLLAPICLGLGAALLGYALWSWTYARPKSRGTRLFGEGTFPPTGVRWLVGLIVIMSVFWAATEYAQAVGRGYAVQIVRDLAARPPVVVYSKYPLFLGPEVRQEDLLPSGTDGYRYRYSQLRFLAESSGRIILLPDRWQLSKGPAIVLPEDGLRMDFYPAAGLWR
jgi:hypothetical protein